jgi:hypothetical protein
MLKLRIDRPMGRQGKFIGSIDLQPDPPPPPHAHTADRWEHIKAEWRDTKPELLKHLVLEGMASILLTMSTLYMPDAPDDQLKQYVSSICIFTVVVALKDAQYFFPDGTPLVTFMLWQANLYTTQDGKTRYLNILARVVGHLAGWGLIMGFANVNRGIFKQYVDLPFTHTHYEIYCVQECLGTMLECIAITFATIPLMSAYDTENINPSNAIESKLEAMPPTNDKLALVGLALAAIHYTLERVFHATMNPLTAIMHGYIRGDDVWKVATICASQVCGIILAAAYVKLCTPSEKTIRKLTQKR